MTIKRSKILNTYLLVIAVACIMQSCAGQSKAPLDCKSHLKTAVKNLNEYYQNGHTGSLEVALNNLNQSIACPETRLRSTDMKISILMLLKRYENGYLFVDSLQTNDFDKPYKKEVSYNYFKALQYESKLDMANRDKLLRNIVGSLENYLKHAPPQLTVSTKKLIIFFS
jgi:hypothetical protein